MPLWPIWRLESYTSRIYDAGLEVRLECIRRCFGKTGAVARSKITKKRDERMEGGNRGIIETKTTGYIVKPVLSVPSIIQVAQLIQVRHARGRLINSLYVFAQRRPCLTRQRLSACKQTGSISGCIATDRMDRVTLSRQFTIFKSTYAQRMTLINVQFK